MGLFPTSAGMDTARWATALEMDKAQSALFEDYRTFWSAQFKKMARIALMGVAKHSKQTVNLGVTIKVTIDTFSLADFPAITETISKFVEATVTPMVQEGVITRSPPAAWWRSSGGWR